MSELSERIAYWRLAEQLSRIATTAVRRERGVTYVDRRGRGYVEHHRACRTCGGSHQLTTEGPRRLIVLRRGEPGERTITPPVPSVPCADCNYRGWIVCTTVEGCTHQHLHGQQLEATP